ncbi:hypothetical protein N9X93_02405 [Alphaproteobacteria bacterium]|nr:hypothetical protein [Alphaproteobacteria bacterium]
MAKHVWIIWVAVELAAVLMLAALWPANASAAPKWKCTSAGGWSMAIDGRRTSIPISDVATVLELSAPDKMRVLNAGSDIERKIYQSGGVDLVIDPYTSARNGVVEITATQLVDIAVAYEKAFNKITLTA